MRRLEADKRLAARQRGREERSRGLLPASPNRPLSMWKRKRREARGLLPASSHRPISVWKRKRREAPRPPASVTTQAIINVEEEETRGPEAFCQRHHTGHYQCGRGRDERPRGLLSASLHRLLSVWKRKRGEAPRPSVSVTTPAVINEEEEERRGQNRLSARPRGLLSASSHRPVWKMKRGEADKRLAQRPQGLLPASPQRPVW